MITRAWHTLLFSTLSHPLLSFLKKRAHRTWSTWPFVNSRAQLSAMLSSDRRGFNQPKARFNYKQKMIVTHLSESRDFTVALHHPNMSKIVATKSRGGDLTWNPPWLIPQPPFSLHRNTQLSLFTKTQKMYLYQRSRWHSSPVSSLSLPAIQVGFVHQARHLCAYPWNTEAPDFFSFASEDRKILLPNMIEGQQIHTSKPLLEL